MEQTKLKFIDKMLSTEKINRHREGVVLTKQSSIVGALLPTIRKAYIDLENLNVHRDNLQF